MAENLAIPGPSQGYAAAAAASEGYTDDGFINVVGQLWGLKINAKELQQMKPEFVQRIYYMFLKDIGVNLETFNEIPSQVLMRLQTSPEDMMPSRRFVVLSSNLRKYFKLIFDDDSFRLADVFNPKPKRTKKFFAMIYDFMVFTDHYFEELEAREDEVNALVEQRDKTNDRLQKIQELIIERRANNTKSEVTKEEEMNRLEEKTQQLKRSQEESLVLKSHLNELNLNLTNLNAITKDTELRILEAKEEKKKLEDLVIKPGEREAIREKDEKLTLLKENNQRTKEHLSQLKQKIQSKIHLKEKVEKSIVVLQEMEQVISKTKERKVCIDEKMSELSDLHERIKSQEDHNLQLTQHLTSTETKFQSMQHTWHLKQESLEKEIKDQKQVYEEINQNLTEDDIASKDMGDAIAEIEHEIDQYKQKMKGNNNMIKNNYHLILDMVEQGNAQLDHTLNEAGENLQEFQNLAE